MLYLTIAFLLFALFVFLRNPKHPTSYYLMGSIIGWTLSFFGFLRYLANHNLSSALVRYFFYVPYELWNALVSAHSSIIASIRIMNSGLALLLVSTYLYVTNVFGGDPKRPARLLPIVPVLLELLFYDPVFYRSLRGAFGPAADGLYALAHPLTRIYNLGLLALPAVSLIRRLIAHRRIPIVRYFYLFNTVGITIVCAAFALTFHWAPAPLARIYPDTTYLIFDLPVYVPGQVYYAAYPYLSVLSFTLVLFALLRYKSLDGILGAKNIRRSRVPRHDDFGVRELGHTLKNQLLAIKFESEALLAGLPASGELAESAAAIHSMAGEAVDGLNEMYRKIQRRELELELVGMKAFLEDYAAKKSPRLPDGIHLEFKPGRLDANALIDKIRIEECLNVAIQNSVEAMGERGGNITLKTELAGIWLVVSVEDEGPGIPSELHSHIGEPFFTTKNSLRNWGLGLSFVKRTLKAHLGTFKVGRAERGGAEVRLYLPIVV